MLITEKGVNGIRLNIYKFKFHILSTKLNFYIRLTAFEEGLSITHVEPVIL